MHKESCCKITSRVLAGYSTNNNKDLWERLSFLLPPKLLLTLLTSGMKWCAGVVLKFKQIRDDWSLWLTTMKSLYSQINLSHNNSDHQQWQGDLHIETHTQCKRTKLSLPFVAPFTLCIKNVVNKLLFARLWYLQCNYNQWQVDPQVTEYGVWHFLWNLWE